MDMPQTIDVDSSDSLVQREIELVMLRRLEEQHPDWQRVPWEAMASEFGLSSVWQKAKPDAVWKLDPDTVIVAECYAHIGKLKAGHRRKLAMDALKLLALRRAVPGGNHVRCLLVVPEELIPVALRLAAEIFPVALLEGERKRLGEANWLQAQGQARIRRTTEGRAE